MRKYLLIILSFTLISLSYGQTDSTLISPPDTTSDGFSYFFSEEETSKYLNYKPIISIGTGVIKSFADVKDRYSQNPIMGNKAINLGISRDLNDFLGVQFNAIYGTLSGNETTENRNLNFKTEVLNGSFLLSYNFYHLLSKPDLLITYREQRKLIPTLGIGLSAFNYNSKTDLLDANGNAYHYWSDGTIRNLSESPENEISSVLLHRDYEYETDLRSLDLDGLGKYNQTAFAIPIDFSLEYNLHKRAILKLGATYFMVLNDRVDNLSSEGTGNRKAKSGGDNYMYTYASIKFDLFSNEKEVFEDGSYFVSADIISAMKTSDEDADGVVDIWDKCLETPVGVEVGDFGCPIDADNDGFPNYLDKELYTQLDSITNMQGVKLTTEEWQSLSDTSLAINQDEICIYYPSMCYDNPRERYRNLFVQIPDKFKYLDEDEDEYISMEEISVAIDDFFNMTSTLSIDDIYELTEFFFSQ